MLILALALSLSALAAPPHDASTGVAATAETVTTGGPRAVAVTTKTVKTGGPRAVAANDGFNDGIDRTDPNFVKASLLIMSPAAERSINAIIYTLMPPLKENRTPIGFGQAGDNP